MKYGGFLTKPATEKVAQVDRKMSYFAEIPESDTTFQPILHNQMVRLAAKLLRRKRKCPDKPGIPN